MKSADGLSAMMHDTLSKQAEALLPAANLCAIATNEIIEDQFPNVHPANPKHWNFVVTVAAVFVANTQLLNLQLESARKQRLMARIIELCNRWNSNAATGFRHCKSFFEQTCNALADGGHDPKFIASDAIGLWLVWELLDRAPANHDEHKLVRIIGVTITREFCNWWKDNSAE